MNVKTIQFRFFLFLLSLTFLSGLLAACGPPEGGDNFPPQVEFRVNPSRDPYVLRDKTFSLAVELEVETGEMAAYDLRIRFDSHFLDMDSARAASGIVAGWDGFVNSVEEERAGSLRVRGSREPGLRQGSFMHLLTFDCIPRRCGVTEVEFEVLSLAGPGGASLNADRTFSYSFAVAEPVTFSLEGIVIDSLAGAPVGGARVTIPASGQETYTDASGSFFFPAVLQGIYDLVATRKGRAGGKLQQVVVTGNHEKVVIIQPEYNLHPSRVTPPEIRLRGVERYGQYRGLIPLKIDTREGSFPVEATDRHQSLYFKVGTTSMAFFELQNASGSEMEYIWQSSLIPSENAVLKVVAYDINNNRSELNVPVSTVAGGGRKPAVAPLPEYYNVVANTYGESLALARSVSFCRVPADTTMYVEFAVRKFYNGVMIYKSYEEEGEYFLLGQSSDVHTSQYKFADFSPDMEPEMVIYYKLAYFNEAGVGPATKPFSVRILPRYKIRLLSPANNGIITDREPTLNWTCEPFLKDAQRTDWIVATNVLDASTICYEFTINQIELKLDPLVYNNRYEWDVRSYYEYNNSEGKANVLSRSFPAGRGASDLSVNGAFYFTVLEERE